VVWIGRPDGAPRRGETGRKAAAPLLFDVFSRLPDRSGAHIYQAETEAPLGLREYQQDMMGAPQILFPPDGAELLATDLGPSSRGFTLSARSHADDLRYYVNGEPIMAEYGQTVWRPETAGFYTVSVVDIMGQTSVSNVEVMSLDQMAKTKF
jgi:penicillin-binding protein 1C